jgi:hypothetical protein
MLRVLAVAVLGLRLGLGLVAPVAVMVRREL